MDWCVNFPKESCIIYRPSLRRACGDNRNAAKFLSYLLYRASIRQEAGVETKHLNKVREQQGLKPDQDDSITILRTQKQVIQEMDHEISDRTLREEAIPCLVELGYITAEPTKTKEQYTAYTVNPIKIQAGIDHPEKVPHFKTMQYYQEILVRKQENLERKNEGSEISPNGKNSEPVRSFFRTGSEKTPNRELKGVGKNSEPKSVSKPAPQAPSEGDSSNPRLLESNIRLNEREDHPSVPSISLSSEEELVYDLAKKNRLSYLKKDEKHKGYCTTLVSEGVTTPEQFQNLMQFCRQRPYLSGKDLCLGNLASELNGWQQTQYKPISVGSNAAPKRPAYVLELEAKFGRIATNIDKREG